MRRGDLRTEPIRQRKKVILEVNVLIPIADGQARGPTRFRTRRAAGDRGWEPDRAP